MHASLHACQLRVDPPRAQLSSGAPPVAQLDGVQRNSAARSPPMDCFCRELPSTLTWSQSTDAARASAFSGVGCCVSHTQTSLAVRFIISPMSPPRHNATGAHTRHVHHPYMLPHHVGPCDTKRKLRASDGRRILPVSESLPSSYQVLVGTSSCSSTGYPKWLSTWYRSSTSDWVSGFVLSTMQSSGCFSCQSFGLI